MNFRESYEYLLSLGNEVTAMKLGLENIGKLLAALGNPEKNYLKIQIAGTNGKGSTVAFLESICTAAKIKTGATTSPHLVSITERIRIDGKEISEKDFACLATKVRQTAEKLVENYKSQIANRKSLIFLETVPTYFEQVTAIALLAFAEAKVELAILETGLGGRFDATTAANAEIAAITPVDYDHQAVLGETLAEIAAEKAAIIREKMRVVVSKQAPEAEKVITEQCRKVNVSPVYGGCEISEDDLSKVNFKTKTDFYPNISLGLRGEHQRENACVAVNLAEILVSDFKFQISTQNIVEGLKTARHNGRLEWRKTGGAQILYDGAHNPAGALALKKYLDKYCAGREIILVFGAMSDKNLTAIGDILFPLAEKLILTKPENPRAEKLETLKKYAENLIDKARIILISDVAQAINAAVKISANSAKSKRSFVCVTGSLYLIGEAQTKITENLNEKQI